MSAFFPHHFPRLVSKRDLLTSENVHFDDWPVGHSPDVKYAFAALNILIRLEVITLDDALLVNDRALNGFYCGPI